MRSPARALADNLMWTRNGSVWAIWRMQALPYGYRPDKDKQEARAVHQALFRGIPGESLLLGVCAALDPVAIVERMISSVDLDQCPDWAAECEATLDTLDQIPIGQRAFWLAVPLGTAGARDKAIEPWRAATADLRDMLGLPRAGLSAKEVARRREQASKVAQGIPAPFRPAPATPAQLVWLHLHAQQRGLFADISLPQNTDQVAEQLLTPRGGASMPEPLLDEGGQSDVDRQSRHSWNPLDRRYLKVSQPHSPGSPSASYQSMLVLSDVPADGMVFPGSEFLGRIDECGLEVDWAIRLHMRSSEQVAKTNRRALINLNEQFGQREGELSHGLSSLQRAAEDLAEYAQILDTDKLEVEVQATVVFAVAAQGPTEVAEQAHQLANYLGDAGYKLQQPLGYQEDLWWAMIPGAPSTRAVREFTQITTSRALSAAVPLASTELGDLSGPVLGINISSGRHGVVHHDIVGISSRNASASIAIAGEKGGGKSLTMKTIAGYVLDCGGRIVAVDRTPLGEWALWGQSVTRAVVVDASNPTLSLDPLRLLGTTAGAETAQTFLTMLLDVAPTSEQGVLLSDVLTPQYLDEHQLANLGALARHLTEDCELPGSHDLGRLMNVFARKNIGRVVFDTDLPLLDYHTPGIIIRTNGLELPGDLELVHQHLFKQMSLQKIMGRALYALIGALARRICFEDQSTLAVYFLDECHHQTRSPEGLAELIEFIRDDRKHKAAVVLGSHDPEADFGSDTLRGLIPTRIQMRQSDETLARKGLKWLDMDPEDSDLLEMLVRDTAPPDEATREVPEHRRGEAFLRDVSGNIGRIKVLAPSLPARNKAVRTTPEAANTPAFRDLQDGGEHG